MSDNTHVVCPHCDGINRVPDNRLAKSSCGACHKPLFSGIPLDLSQLRFQKHISKNDLPVLVDVWAPWCGPCKMMAPIFVQAAEKLEPQLRLVKVNSEQEQALSGQLNIRSIPTIILYKQGKEVARMSGAMELQNLLAWVRQYL